VSSDRATVSAAVARSTAS